VREIQSPVILEWQEGAHERVRVPYWQTTNSGQYYVFKVGNIFIAGKRAYGREYDFDEIFTSLADAINYCQGYESAQNIIVAS
jgi:hypothetical protein